MLSKVLSILFMILQIVKEKKLNIREYSSQLLQSEEHTVRRRNKQGGGVGGMWESEGKKQRFSSNEYLAGVLPES